MWCGVGHHVREPAVLFGLENIAELHWESEERLEGLIAHELGHVAHTLWRGEPLEPLEKDPLGLLYVEGFAQRLEGVIVGSEGMHQAQDNAWLSWCQAHLVDLARAYENRALRGEKVNDFFGSWLDVQGVPFTGYFLGHVVVRLLEEQLGLRELAQAPLADVRSSVAQVLGGLAEGPSTTEEGLTLCDQP